MSPTETTTSAVASCPNTRRALAAASVNKHCLPTDISVDTPTGAALAATLCAHIEVLAAANSNSYLCMHRSEPTNRFSSRTVPPLTLSRLAEMMERGTECGDNMSLSAALLLVRYCETTGTALTMKMMHRMYIAALHVAIKTHCDRYFRNDTFARLAGISTLELNLLEAAFIHGLHWRCLVDATHAIASAVDPAAFVCAAVPSVVLRAADATVGCGTSTGHRTTVPTLAHSPASDASIETHSSRSSDCTTPPVCASPHETSDSE